MSSKREAVPSELNDKTDSVSTDTNRRIAVVGAGPAGLTAAMKLRKLGYQHVTVFERRNRVGGKCLTVEIEGRNYELGAVIVGTTTYTTVNALLEELGLECRPVGKAELLSTEAGGALPKFGILKNYMTRYRPAIRRYLASLKDTPTFAEPGYLGFDPDTFGQRFAEWLSTHDAEAMTEILGPIYTGFGYGYLDEVSVPQVLKIYDEDRLRKAVAVNPFRRASMLTIEVGFQGLWEKVAADLDVRCGSNIQQIVRDKQIRITTEEQTDEFDELILACPLHKVQSALDTTEEEHMLFQQIRTYDYRTITASVDGLGPKGLVFFTDNLTTNRAGRIVCGYRRWKESNIWALYIMSDGNVDDAEIMKRLQSDLEAVGAQMHKVHREDKWEFYPHVDADDFRAGFYPQMEGLQGKNHTYFAGEIMAAASVESVARYSVALVSQYFGPETT